MNKFVKLSLILSVIIASQAIFASSHGDHKTHVVQMKNMGTLGAMVFEPSFLKINLGDSVLFEMADAGHNAVTVAAPSGSKPFDTRYEPSTKVTFDVKGLYLYKCAPHAMMAMAGIIQVADANNSQEIIAAIQKFEDTVMMPNVKTRISDLFKENVKEVLSF
ncbi:MAG: pseudoazurin [Gammaproteobacteria bacterium]|nr:pseudoazurin [Gammaproteobacteria bacterium]